MCFYLFPPRDMYEISYRAGWVIKQDTVQGIFHLLGLCFLTNTLLILGLCVLFTVDFIFVFHSCLRQ